MRMSFNPQDPDDVKEVLQALNDLGKLHIPLPPGAHGSQFEVCPEGEHVAISYYRIDDSKEHAE